MIRSRYFQAMILASILVASCGGGSGGTPANNPTQPPGTTYTAASGVAQKGPLAKGSTITAQELDANLNATGTQYSYQVDSELGSFAPTAKFASKYIGVTATGNYFDEATNTTSSGTVTLNGVSDLSTDSVLNVNLLTTLAYQRIKTLVKSGKAFADARTQAEGEVLAALNIHNASSYGSFSTLDIGKGRDGDKMLAALSTLFTYGNTAENLNALIASFQSDLAANGSLTNPATKTTLAASAKALNPAAAATNLSAKYASANLSFTAADISGWLDQAGDGVIGKLQFQVAGASQSSKFTFPSSVTDPYAGSSVSVSLGQLAVNGSPVTGAATIKSGDSVSVSPPAGSFPNGVLTTYLMSGNTRIAKVSFVSGLASITVTPANPSLPIGVTQQLKATGVFTDASTADVTSSVTWSSSAPSIATVGANSGIVEALAAGQVTMTAASGNVAGTTTVTVPNVALKSLAVTPSQFTTGVGIAHQLTATGTFSDGTTANMTANAVWTTSPSSVATVTGGSVAGIVAGTATVTAAIGAISASGAVTVTPHNTWNPTASLPTVVAEPKAILLPNGSVFVFGSVTSLGIAPVQLYDPVADKWTAAATSLTGRVWNSVTLLANGKVLVAGGSNTQKTSDFLATAEIYDPVTNQWSTAASMPTSRSNHTATLLPSGKVLVVGGGFSTSAPLLYDPAANSWSSTGSMVVPRDDCSATLLPNGKVLVAGGSVGDNRVTSAELYDPATNTWSAVPDMADGRSQPVATLLADGRVLVAGGETNSTTGSAEIYDPATNKWSVTGTMSSPRLYAAATLLPDGTVLMTGGVAGGNGAMLATAEIYNPASGKWSAAASMAHTQLHHSAIVLPNGAALVIGQDSELYW